MDHQCGCGGHHKDEGELGIEYSLHQKINFEEFECLNEREDGSGVKVFKAWEDRLNKDTVRTADVLLSQSLECSLSTSFLKINVNVLFKQ